MMPFMKSAIRYLLVHLAVICIWPAMYAAMPADWSHPRLLAQTNPSENPKTGAQSDTRTQALFEMPSQQFFTMEKSNRPIEVGNLDHKVLAAALYHAANQRRRQQGKSSLGHLPRLDEAALMHAQSMAENTYLSHENPTEPQLRTPWKRVRRTGLDPRMTAENIGTHFAIRYTEGMRVYPVRKDGRQGFSKSPGGPLIPAHTYKSFADAMMDQWMDSPGHRRNVLAEEPEFSGAGCAAEQDRTGMQKLYCVQMFFSPR